MREKVVQNKISKLALHSRQGNRSSHDMIWYTVHMYTFNKRDSQNIKKSRLPSKQTCQHPMKIWTKICPVFLLRFSFPLSLFISPYKTFVLKYTTTSLLQHLRPGGKPKGQDQARRLTRRTRRLTRRTRRRRGRHAVRRHAREEGRRGRRGWRRRRAARDPGGDLLPALLDQDADHDTASAQGGEGRREAHGALWRGNYFITT